MRLDNGVYDVVKELLLSSVGILNIGGIRPSTDICWLLTDPDDFLVASSDGLLQHNEKTVVS